MKKFILLSLLCIIYSAFVPNTIEAQKRRTSKLTREQRLANIDSLMREYRFSEAIGLIDDEITLSTRSKLPTDTLEWQLETAEMGERMIENTVQVQFVDSFLCSKSAILNYIRPAAGAGTLDIGHDGEPASLSYTNEFEDRTIFSQPRNSGSLRLVEKVKLGNDWAPAQELEGLDDREAEQMVAPFLMSDGMSLYFAEESEESLGELDIFVTRMGPMRSYLLPENIGMPFNSPANDYLYVVDEEQNLGWFVTDRRQSGDTVCVYVFIPPTTRKTYAADMIYDADEIRRFALIESVEASQLSELGINEARTRLQAALAREQGAQRGGSFRFSIGDGRVITDLQGFSSAEVMQTAIEWDNARREQEKLELELQGYRTQWHSGNHSDVLRKNILAAESRREAMAARVAELANKIRSTEK